ncbi:hypothetical protein B4123_1120 [Bacillus paralicheniformis]|nr:hypothetical protein B4123_1120 [Bacillus paralicheniformis]TWJ56865.1 hypothetical protein CHCC5023_1110 [Bacillus paralicheniformis]TWJ80622.1 hypothetical protein CHCC5019_3515 [Bacillus paralicheniformis]TWN88965.1 hypothetical protein CHCC20490_1521 [Bacillus paralicheniformis]
MPIGGTGTGITVDTGFPGKRVALLGILLVNMSFFATRVCFFAEGCSSCFWSV